MRCEWTLWASAGCCIPERRQSWSLPERTTCHHHPCSSEGLLNLPAEIDKGQWRQQTDNRVNLYFWSCCDDQMTGGNDAYVAARAHVTTGADHCWFHITAPPVAAGADTVANNGEESLLEPRGNGTSTCKKCMKIINPKHSRGCVRAVSERLWPQLCGPHQWHLPALVCVFLTDWANESAARCQV